MNNTFFYTDVLKPAMAKKIVESLTTRPEWKDVMGGIGGIVVVKESTKISTDAALLAQVVIPNAAYFELTRISDTVDSLRTPVDLLGGYSHGLPKDIGDTAIGIRAISEESGFSYFDYILANSHLHQHSMREMFPQRVISSSSQTTVSIQYFASDQLPTECVSIQNYAEVLKPAYTEFMSMLAYLGLPCAPFDRFAKSERKFDWTQEANIAGMLNWSMICSDQKFYFRMVFEPSVLPQWSQAHIKMQEWLKEKGCSYKLSAHVNYGGMNWFAGLTTCVTQEANELIQKEAVNPQYDKYLIEYKKLEPDTWESREKRRKKVTEPIYQQLGECTLENGAALTLRMKMHKQGYEISVDFPSPDDMANFLDTDLYRMTKWHCAAE